MSIEKAVLLLHGWPGTSDDYHLVRSILPPDVRVIAPDLTGYGRAFEGHLPTEQATADAHANKLLMLIDSDNIKRPIVAGYDIGSRIAQTIALKAPDKIGGIVVTPAYPGIGNRIANPDIQPLFWYQHFHRLDVAGDALDGNRSALSAYIKHFLSTWSYRENVVSGNRFEKLIDFYARPNAFRASIAWYSANKGYTGSGKIVVPTTMLWPEKDSLFPIEWADRLPDYFKDATLTPVPDCGHFVPLEAPETFANAILNQIRSRVD